MSADKAVPPENLPEARLMRRATVAAVAVSGSLILVKGAAWIATGSVAMLASLVDSLLDAVASTVNLIAVRHALEPPDAEHRFGHGKAEPLAGLAQSAVIVISALFLLRESFLKFIDPEPVTAGGVGIAVIVLSIVASLALVAYQRHVIGRTRSVAIEADSIHYQGDLLMNLGVIVALGLSSFGGLPLADPVFGVFIALFIAAQAWRILRRSYDQLMDREFPDEERARVEAVLNAHPEVVGVFDLRTRISGVQRFIQANLEFPPHMTLAQVHDVTDEVEDTIRAAFPGAEVVIHPEPEGHNVRRAVSRVSAAAVDAPKDGG
ncbi:MAG: cation diffusion facilitator family transporter [Alphaproteobacteria bacterium]